MASVGNNIEKLWGAAPSASSGEDATWFSLWKSETGTTAADYLGAIEIANDPSALTTGDRYKVSVNMIRLVMGAVVVAGDGAGAGLRITDELAQRTLAGAVAGGLWVEPHDGDPGASGRDHLIQGNLGRIQISQSEFTVASG